MAIRERGSRGFLRGAAIRELQEGYVDRLRQSYNVRLESYISLSVKGPPKWMPTWLYRWLVGRVVIEETPQRATLEDE